MKKQWCWRCQKVVPMLEEEEYQMALRINSKASINVKSIQDRFEPLVNYYHQVTGYKEENPNAILHHALHLYGSPCEQCGKPYRISEAAFCAACGYRKKQ